MPNYCENTLEVSGAKSDLAKYFRENTGEESSLSFEKLLPTPEEHRNNNKIGEGWWQWRITNWGTKWDVDHKDTVCDYQAGVVTYKFDTAWSPPRAWVYAAAEAYPTLTFELRYYEPGMGFQGTLCIIENEVQIDVSEDIPSPEEDYLIEDESP